MIGELQLGKPYVSGTNGNGKGKGDKAMFNNKNREIITTAIELGNFGNTAKRLGTSKATISQSIKEEESEIGVKLFDKIGKAKQPTLAGKLYREAAQLIDGIILDFWRKATNSPTLESGIVRIGASRSFAMDLVNPVIYDFHAIHPKVNFATRTNGYEKEILSMLVDGDIDIAIVSSIPLANYRYRFDSIPLFRLSPVLLVPKNHPFAIAHTGSEIDWSETKVLDDNYIGMEPNHPIHFAYEELRTLTGVAPRPWLEVDNTFSAAYMSLQTNSCALVSQTLINNDRMKFATTMKHYHLTNKLMDKNLELAFDGERNMTYAVKRYIEMFCEKHGVSCPDLTEYCKKLH